jgi:hypothetical protein
MDSLLFEKSALQHAGSGGAVLFIHGPFLILAVSSSLGGLDFLQGLCNLHDVELGECGRDIAWIEGKIARMSDEAEGILQGQRERLREWVREMNGPRQYEGYRDQP